MEKIKQYLIVPLLFLLGIISVWAQSEPFSITINRNNVSGNLVYGTIYLNGQEIGATFENNELKIPSGTYKGLMRYNSGKNFVQSEKGKLSTKGDFLLEASGVSGRTDILLHQGNAPKHSLGCILLGPAKRDPNRGVTIGDEHPLRKLRLAFYGTDEPNSSPNKNITITIQEDYNPTGTYVSPEYELLIIKNADRYSGTIKLTYDGETEVGNIQNINIANGNVSFSFTYSGESISYTGKLSSDFREITNFKMSDEDESESLTLMKK